MRALEGITDGPAKMGGLPRIRGMRRSARRPRDADARYPKIEERRREYADLVDEDIRQGRRSSPLLVQEKFE